MAQWEGNRIVGGAPGQTSGSGMGGGVGKEIPTKVDPKTLTSGFDTKTGAYYDSSGKLVSVPGSVTRNEQGTYRDPKTGLQITQEQAAEKGLIDRPETFVQKAVAAGVTASEIMRGSSKESVSSNLSEFGYVSTKGIYDPVKAAESVKQDLVSGYIVTSGSNTEYFYTRSEAEAALKRPPTVQQETPTPKGTPPLYHNLQATKDLLTNFPDLLNLYNQRLTPISTQTDLLFGIHNHKPFPSATYESYKGNQASYREFGESILQAVTSTAAPAQVPQTGSDMSQFSRDIYSGASRVAAVIGTGMGIADIGARRIERQLPGGLSDIYTGTYQLGKGIFLTAPKAIVEMAGMIPGGVETIAKNVPMLPAFAAAGVISQVSGLQEGFTQRPLQTAGELIGTAAIVGRVPAGLRTIRNAVPYDIAIGKPTGVIVEVGKMYVPKVEAVPDIPGLVSRTTQIAPEGMQAFATRPAEGISNVFMRLPQAAVSRLQAEAIVSAPEFVSTPYGSYMKVSIEGMKESLPGAAETGAKATKPTKQIGLTDMPTDVELKALSNLEFAHRMGEIPALQDIQTASYPVFRRMGLETKTIPVSKLPQDILESGVLGRTRYDPINVEGTIAVELGLDVSPAMLMRTLGHEIAGHATSQRGLKQPIISEPLAIRNAERFLNEFDKYYKTDLSKVPAESRPISAEGLPYILGDIIRKIPYKPESYFKYEAAIPTIETPTLMQKLTPTIQKGASAIKAAPEDILTSLQERIRIERKLDIYPAEFKLGEPQSPRAQIPKYTGVYDIWPESPMAGKPGMNYDVWGGIIEGAAAKTEIVGSTGFKQLTSPKLQTMEELFGRPAPSPKVQETGSGISFTQPDIPFDMPASTGGFGIEAVGKRTTVKTTSRQTFIEQPFELSPQLELKSVPKIIQFAESDSPIMKGFEDMTPKLQLEKVTTKRQMKVMDREPIIYSLKMFKEESVPTKTPLYFVQKTTSFDTGFDTHVPPKPTPIETVPDYITDIFTLPSITKTDTTRKHLPIYTPSPLPKTFPDPSAFPFPEAFPQPKEQTRPHPKPEPGREFGEGFFNFKIPEIPINKLLLTKFDKVRTAKKKKKTTRKITSYQIRNPLTDLEDVLGIMDADIRKEMPPSKKKRKSEKKRKSK